MSAGLLRGFDRVTVTRLSFLLSVPALTAAGVLQAVTEADDISAGVGWPATLVATAVSFVVGVRGGGLAAAVRRPAQLHGLHRLPGRRSGSLLLAAGRVRGARRDLTARPRGDVQVDLDAPRELRRRPAAIASVESSTPAAPERRRPCPAGPRRAARPDRPAWSAPRRPGRPRSGRQLAADPSRTGAGAASPMSISLVSRPSTYATRRAARRSRSRPRVPVRLPGQLMQAEPERGQHQADQRRGVLGEHGLHGRVGGQPDVLDHRAALLARASARSCRTALSQECPPPRTRRTAPRTRAGSRRPRTRRSSPCTPS